MEKLLEARKNQALVSGAQLFLISPGASTQVFATNFLLNFVLTGNQ